MRYINQREFGLHNVKLYRANKCSVNFLSANLHSHKKWTKLCVKTYKNKIKLN